MVDAARVAFDRLGEHLLLDQLVEDAGEQALVGQLLILRAAAGAGDDHLAQRDFGAVDRGDDGIGGNVCGRCLGCGSWAETGRASIGQDDSRWRCHVDVFQHSIGPLHLLRAGRNVDTVYWRPLHRQKVLRGPTLAPVLCCRAQAQQADLLSHVKARIRPEETSHAGYRNNRQKGLWHAERPQDQGDPPAGRQDQRAGARVSRR